MNIGRIASLGVSATLLTSFSAFAEDYMPAEYQPAVEYQQQNTAVRSTDIYQPAASGLADFAPVAAFEAVESQEAAASKNPQQPGEMETQSAVAETLKPVRPTVDSVQREQSSLSVRNALLVLLAASGVFMYKRKKPVPLSRAVSEPVPSALTGVERYLDKVSPTKTGVTRYLEKQAVSAPSTGVAKYLAKQAVKNRT